MMLTKDLINQIMQSRAPTGKNKKSDWINER